MTICGEITSDRVEQVKGVTYSLRQFLGREHAWLTNPVGRLWEGQRACVCVRARASWVEYICQHV